MRETYLVTGGAGFIGSHVVVELLRRGKSVRATGNVSTEHRENLPTTIADVHLVEGELDSCVRAHDAVAGVAYATHLAVLPSVPRSVQNPLTSRSVNITCTLNILRAARDADARLVVTASCSSVFGPWRSLRGTSLRFRVLCFALQGLEARGGAVHGGVPRGVWPRVRRSDSSTTSVRSRIPTLSTAASFDCSSSAPDGQDPVIYGVGLQKREFTNVSSVVEATLSALSSDKGSRRVINVDCSGWSSLLDLVAAVERASGRPLNPSFAPERPGDVKHSCADISRARDLLGYTRRISFSEGVGKSFEAVATHLALPRNQR